MCLLEFPKFLFNLCDSTLSYCSWGHSLRSLTQPSNSISLGNTCRWRGDSWKEKSSSQAFWDEMKSLFLGPCLSCRALSGSGGMEAEPLRASVEELDPGTGGLQPRSRGAHVGQTQWVVGSRDLAPKSRRRRGSSLLEAARRRAGTEPWGSRRKCPVGREQKGSICSSPNTADNSSSAVCEFLHGEKKKTRISL